MAGTVNKTTEVRTLRDFTRLVIAFFCSLVVLAFYQQLRLYASGVLDQLIGKSLFLLIVHHLGFAAVVSLPLSFLFNALERKKPALGYRMVWIVLLLLLITEGILIEYYITHFEILGQGFLHVYGSHTSFAEFILILAILTPFCFGGLFIFYRITSSTYKIIGRMYPFTIILFSLFLGTQYSSKKPVNENKTQHLIVDISKEALSNDKYEGEQEFPLLKKFQPNSDLEPFIDLKDDPPNLVFVILEGIGSDFIGKNSAYPGFTPYLDSLATRSLFWSNHLSNTAESHASLATVLGSLPFGQSGFNKSKQQVNRNTLLGMLKKNGYVTSFNYGGNSALYQWDKFLFEDRIDQMLDIKGFGKSYSIQKKDAAGISLGYPDKELFRKWYDDRGEPEIPFVEVFFTLSTKRPYHIPNRDKYINRVEALLETVDKDRKTKRTIRRNEELFASVLYADEALANFMRHFQTMPEYSNTIFIITGSHNMSDLPQMNPLSRYRVPLIIHSPLLKESQEIHHLVSHADILPSLTSLLKVNYDMNFPEGISYLGTGLLGAQTFDSEKQIPLYRHESNIKDFVSGSYFLSGNYTYKMNADLELLDIEQDSLTDQIKQEFKEFKAINRYVIEENKLIPNEETLYASAIQAPNKQEMIWINSVFNGSDFDNAYQTARSLALGGQHERALLLCSYILSQVPAHADTEILMGRIHAWQGDYETASSILERAILKYPVYPDAYSALLDVYFWSGKNHKALLLQKQIKRNRIESAELKQKISRSVKQQQVMNEAAEKTVDNPKLNQHASLEAVY